MNIPAMLDGNSSSKSRTEGEEEEEEEARVEHLPRPVHHAAVVPNHPVPLDTRGDRVHQVLV